MIPVATAAQVRALDAAVIQQVGVPGRQLMEIAGRGAAEQIHQGWPGATVAVFCGPGNNGGDGYVVARWLHHWGHAVRLVIGRPAATPDAQVNARLCTALGIAATALDDDAGLDRALHGVDLVVDALLGTGQQDAPRGFALAGLDAMRRAAVRVALDVPTGLCADTGQELGPPLPRFDLTVTFGRIKRGLLCAPGCVLAGRVHSVDIGLDLAGLVDADLVDSDALLLEAADIDAWQPPEDAADAKWNRGHVAIRAAGGAAVLAAHGAFRAPVGLVTLLAPRADWPAFHGLWPEVILAEPDSLDPRRHDAVVIGPGLGADHADEVRRTWREFPGPVLADADALNILARKRTAPPEGAVRALTPHSAEAARLVDLARDQVDADRFAACQLLRSFGTPLLKGPCSLIGASGATWVNPTGDQHLATAGTGDVLAGLAGGYLARGLPAERALALAAWRHGAAGQALGPRATASDLVEGLRR